MSICPSCKAENPDSHQFCQFCGAKIAIDIPLNILGEEALQPSSVPTRPFNLESALETIKIQVHDLASSQLVSDIEEKSLDDSEDLEELPPEFNLEDFADCIFPCAAKGHKLCWQDRCGNTTRSQ
jgi:hypothetical protein